MYFKLLSVDSKPYQFNLSDIAEQDWKYFIEDLILGIAGNKVVRSIMATVTIRDNNAKVKIAYCDDVHHEICFRLDEFGTKINNGNDSISVKWQQLMSARFGEEYLRELKNNSITVANC